MLISSIDAVELELSVVAMKAEFGVRKTKKTEKKKKKRGGVKKKLRF